MENNLRLVPEERIVPYRNSTPIGSFFLVRTSKKEAQSGFKSLAPQSSLRLSATNMEMFVPEERLELSWVSPHDFESCAYTNSATPA